MIQSGRTVIVTLIVTLASLLPTTVVAADPAGIEASFELVAEGLDQPTFATHAGDGSGRLFVVEKAGRILTIEADGSLLEEPFLDLSDRTKSDGFEQGLLGLAFHPRYAENGRLFVDYTRAPDGATVVSEFASTNGIPDPASERVRLLVPQRDVAHNGGMLAFDRQDRLLIGLGDGGNRRGTWRNALDPESLLGKIVALDVEADAVTETDEKGVIQTDPEVVETLALGLRNPWRFSIDDVNGDIYIGDVGLWSWEEINVLPANSERLNFGWGEMEGPECGLAGRCDPGAHVAPAVAYRHSPAGSVMGGYAYHGVAEPLLEGLYVFGDFSSGHIMAVRVDDLASGAATPVRIGTVGSGGVRSFGVDESGELYVVGATSIQRIRTTERFSEPLIEPVEFLRQPQGRSLAYDIESVTFAPSTDGIADVRAPEVLNQHDVTISSTADGCIGLEPTGADPWVSTSLSSGHQLVLIADEAGTAQVFLGIDGRFSDGQSIRKAVQPVAYLISIATDVDDEPTILRVDPPASGGSSLCEIGG